MKATRWLDKAPVFALAALALAGCANMGCACLPECAPGGCVSLRATPESFTFALDNDTPEPIALSRSPSAFRSLTLSVADPTVVGVTAPLLSGRSATFSIVPIARGSTTVDALDSSGLMVPVGVTTASCGRPPTLLAAQQVVPAAGSTAAPLSLGTVYLVAYYVGSGSVSVTGKLHVIAGAHGTLEGGPLVAATLPPGTVLPSPLPIPNATGVLVSATIPALASSQTYQTEPYNDTCQQAVLAGSFST